MPDISFVYSFVQENFPNVLVSRGGSHFNFRCPFCGDSKKNTSKRRFHLQFNSEDSIFFNCFNCPATGNFYDLYALVKGMDSEEAFKELNKYSPELIQRKLSTTKIDKKKTFDFPPNSNFNSFLKNDCLSESHVPKGMVEKTFLDHLKRFKEERKITSDVFVCTKGRFQKRFIIPIYQDDVCVFFQGRRIVETMEPKYLNPTVEKENIILNKHMFDKDKFIIVTEGILDADSLGTQGTTCLGASISDEFLEQLFKYTNKGVVIALDNDETGRKNIEKILKYSSYNKKLSYFFLEDYKDLNKFYVESNVSDVYKYVVDNMLSYLESHLKLRGFC